MASLFLLSFFLSTAVCAEAVNEKAEKAEEALAQQSPEEMARLEALCRRLGDGDEGQRWEAARTLVQEGQKAIAPLAGILRGGWAEGRKMAAWALGQIGSAQGAAALVTALGDAEPDVRWKAAVSLVQIGPEAAPHLRKQLEAESALARQCAAWALGQLRDKDAAADLGRALADADEHVRWKAAISLTQIGKDAIPVLLQELRSDHERARQCAVWSLGQLGSQVTPEIMDGLLRDPDSTVRAKTAVAAASIGGELGTRLASRLAADSVQLVRLEAWRSLTKLQQGAKDAAPVAEVDCYGLFEFQFAVDEESVKDELGPWVNFLSPSFRSRRVRSFRSEAGRAVARFSPDEPGIWYYEGTSAVAASLPGTQGVFQCSKKAGRRAPLRIREGLPPGLESADGSAYFPLGGGTLGLNGRKPSGEPANTMENWKKFLADCSQVGINHVRLFLLEIPWVRPEDAVQFPEYSPWLLNREGLHYDLKRFEPAFWEKLDQILKAGLQHGVVFELVIFDEVGLDAGKGNRWELHPFNQALGGPVTGKDCGWPAFYDLSSEANRSAQERFVAYLLARTSGFPNIYYQVNNEMGGGEIGGLGMDWLKHWVDFFDRNGPEKRLISLSVLEGGRRYAALAGIDIVNLHEDSPKRIQKLEKPQMISLPLVGSAEEERELLWSSLLAGLPCARRPWLPLDERGDFFKAAPSLARLLETADGWAFRPNQKALLSLPPGIRAAAGDIGPAVWVYFSGNYRGEGLARLGHSAERVHCAWISTESGSVLREGVETPKQGILELRPPDFQTDILLEIKPEGSAPLRTTGE